RFADVTPAARILTPDLSSAEGEGKAEDTSDNTENLGYVAGTPLSRALPIVHRGHIAPVFSVVFSPGGKLVVSGGSDNTIRIWDADSQFPIGEPLKGHDGSIHSISYCPLGDLVASGSDDCIIRLWDTKSGQQVGKRLMGHTRAVFSVAFSSDAKLLASGSKDTTIRLWGVNRGETIGSSWVGHTGWVRAVAFSPDGAGVVSGSDDKTVRVWDVQREVGVITPLTGHKYVVRSVALSPNGSQIVSGSYDKTIRLWDVRTGDIVGKPYIGHTGRVYSVAFSPNGTYIASGSDDKTVCVWDVRTGRKVEELIKEHTHHVHSVAYSPCGGSISYGACDNTIMIWRISGNDSGADDESQPMAEDGAGMLELDRSIELVGKHMSMQEMLDLLLRHGCIDLTSQVDDGPNTIKVNGGGFGDIWKGSLRKGPKVAIKVWRGAEMQQYDYKTLKRAIREIYLWSKMKHNNVHQLMGVLMFKGQYIGMVSEWMNHGNLHEYMYAKPDFDRLQMCVQVTCGLAYMHRCNAVHGDLKALNVLVSSDGTAKLTDFGLSTMSQSSLAFSATSGSYSGSLRWAAPELIFDEAPKSKQSDVYALGMTMLEIFTGALPYSEYRKDYVVLMKLQKGDLPTRPEQIKHDDPGSKMWQLLLRCWGRSENARPSAEYVSESLLLLRLSVKPNT
ncbi:unnamed protein product, partial [Rhizoctonia solani]